MNITVWGRFGDVVTVIDDEDWPKVEKLNLLYHNDRNGYVMTSAKVNGVWTSVTLHSLIIGNAPEGLHTDHVNGNPLDNRKSNLAFVTPQFNQVNRKRLNANSTSGVRGVSWNSRDLRWTAHIKVDYRKISLGSYALKENAIAARRAAELEYFGEYCPVPSDESQFAQAQQTASSKP